jgi:hypothetical protein
MDASVLEFGEFNHNVLCDKRLAKEKVCLLSHKTL